MHSVAIAQQKIAIGTTTATAIVRTACVMRRRSPILEVARRTAVRHPIADEAVLAVEQRRVLQRLVLDVVVGVRQDRLLRLLMSREVLGLRKRNNSRR